MVERELHTSVMKPSSTPRFAEIVVIAVLLAVPLWMMPVLGGPNRAKMFLFTSAVVVLLGALLVRAWRTQRTEVRIPWIFLGAFLLVLAALVSVPGATNPWFALASVVFLCLFVSWGLVVSHLAARGDRVRRVLAALLCAGGTVACIAILQATGVLGDPKLMHLERATSTFGNWNFLGSYLGIIVFPSTALLFSAKNLVSRIAVWLGCVLCFFVLTMVQQTGIIVSLGLALVFLVLSVLAFRLLGLLRAHITTVLALSLAVILGSAGGIVWWRAAPHDAPREPAGGVVESLWSANHGRTREIDWFTGLEMFATNPWNGVGLGNYKVEFLEYKSRFLEQSDNPRYEKPIVRAEQAHNDYLQALAEMGSIGGLAIVACFVLAVVAFWKRMRALPPADVRRLELLGLLAGLVVALAHAAVSFPFHLPASGLAFATLLGVSSSTYFGDAATRRLRLRASKTRLVACAGLALLLVVALGIGWELRSQILFARGRALNESGRLQESAESLEASVSALPASPRRHLWLSDVELLLAEQARSDGDLDASVDWLTLAIDHARLSQRALPSEETYLSLAGLALRLGDTTLAHESLSTLLRSRPYRTVEANARYLRAVLNAQEGEYEAAKQELRDLMVDFPAQAQASILLGDLLVREGDTAEAHRIHEAGLAAVMRELERNEADLADAAQREIEDLERERRQLLGLLDQLITRLGSP